MSISGLGHNGVRLLLVDLRRGSGLGPAVTQNESLPLSQNCILSSYPAYRASGRNRETHEASKAY